MKLREIVLLTEGSLFYKDKSLFGNKFTYDDGGSAGSEVYTCIEANRTKNELLFVLKKFPDGEKIHAFCFNNGKLPNNIKELK